MDKKAITDNEELLERLKANEDIARKFFEIESEILATGNFKELLERLLLLIEEKFQLSHVWLSIIKDSPLFSLVGDMEESTLVSERLNIIEHKIFYKLTNGQSKPLLVNEDLKPFFRLLPENRKYLFKSLSLSPLTLGGEIIGSLNLGDKSESRFHPKMDTFFLSQLAVKISICLSNVMAGEKLNYLATRDALTSLFNRREMDEMLEKEFSRSKRYVEPLALLFIDCDDFKKINDLVGHQCGDALLKYLAQTITSVIRKTDMAFRYAGDEFIVLLPKQGKESAATAVERIRQKLAEEPLVFEGKTISMSFSCGISSSEEDDIEKPEDMLKKADQQLYGEKKEKAKKASQAN